MSESEPNAFPPEDEFLNLPDGRDFRPPPHQFSLEEVIRFSEERLAMINGRPCAREEREARRAREPFRL